MITTATVNLKGQITIPHQIRQELGLLAGDEIELVVQNQALVLTSKEHRIEAAFGLYAAKHSVSLDEMEAVIRNETITVNCQTPLTPGRGVMAQADAPGEDACEEKRNPGGRRQGV